MAFVFGFGPCKAPKSRFEVSVSDIAPQAAARSNPKIPGDQAGQCRSPGILNPTWEGDIRERNFKPIFRGFGGSKTKKEGHFRVQWIKFDRKIPKYGNRFFGEMLRFFCGSAQPPIHSTNLGKNTDHVFLWNRFNRITVSESWVGHGLGSVKL